MLQGGASYNVSDYSHGTGFINWWGWDPIAADRTFLTDVTAPVRRAATVITVSLQLLLARTSPQNTTIRAGHHSLERL